jgi:hypothetical protein
VGFMCFKGLNLHLPEIKALLEASPETTVIIDHFGFLYQVSCQEGTQHECLIERPRTGSGRCGLGGGVNGGSSLARLQCWPGRSTRARR